MNTSYTSNVCSHHTQLATTILLFLEVCPGGIMTVIIDVEPDSVNYKQYISDIIFMSSCVCWELEITRPLI